MSDVLRNRLIDQKEMDALCTQWHQNIKQVKQNQKAQFRQRVLELHAMWERKEAYESAWIAELTQPTSKAIHSTMVSPAESLPTSQPDPVVERKVSELLEMGFTAEQARASLHISQQDMVRMEPSKILVSYSNIGPRDHTAPGGPGPCSAGRRAGLRTTCHASTEFQFRIAKLFHHVSCKFT